MDETKIREDKKKRAREASQRYKEKNREEVNRKERERKRLKAKEKKKEIEKYKKREIEVKVTAKFIRMNGVTYECFIESLKKKVELFYQIYNDKKSNDLAIDKNFFPPDENKWIKVGNYYLIIFIIAVKSNDPHVQWHSMCSVIIRELDSIKCLLYDPAADEDIFFKKRPSLYAFKRWLGKENIQILKYIHPVQDTEYSCSLYVGSLVNELIIFFKNGGNVNEIDKIVLMVSNKKIKSLSLEFVNCFDEPEEAIFEKEELKNKLNK